MLSNYRPNHISNQNSTHNKQLEKVPNDPTKNIRLDRAHAHIPLITATARVCVECSPFGFPVSIITLDHMITQSYYGCSSVLRVLCAVCSLTRPNVIAPDTRCTRCSRARSDRDTHDRRRHADTPHLCRAPATVRFLAVELGIIVCTDFNYII